MLLIWTKDIQELGYQSRFLNLKHKFWIRKAGRIHLLIQKFSRTCWMCRISSTEILMLMSCSKKKSMLCKLLRSICHQNLDHLQKGLIWINWESGRWGLPGEKLMSSRKLLSILFCTSLSKRKKNSRRDRWATSRDLEVHRGQVLIPCLGHQNATNPKTIIFHSKMVDYPKSRA